MIWLVVWNMFYFSIYIYIGNFMIPTDFHIFQRGRYTTNQTTMILFYDDLDYLGFMRKH